MQANPKECGALGVLINGALSCVPAKTPETNGVKLVAIRHRFPSPLPANQWCVRVCEGQTWFSTRFSFHNQPWHLSFFPNFLPLVCSLLLFLYVCQTSSVRLATFKSSKFCIHFLSPFEDPKFSVYQERSQFHQLSITDETSYETEI